VFTFSPCDVHRASLAEKSVALLIPTVFAINPISLFDTDTFIDKYTAKFNNCLGVNK
jgi:hypothetical protein